MGSILFVFVSWIFSIYFSENIFNVLVRRSGYEVGPFMPKKLSESKLVSLFEH